MLIFLPCSAWWLNDDDDEIHHPKSRRDGGGDENLKKCSPVRGIIPIGPWFLMIAFDSIGVELVGFNENTGGQVCLRINHHFANTHTQVKKETNLSTVHC